MATRSFLFLAASISVLDVFIFSREVDYNEEITEQAPADEGENRLVQLPAAIELKIINWPSVGSPDQQFSLQSANTATEGQLPAVRGSDDAIIPVTEKKMMLFIVGTLYHKSSRVCRRRIRKGQGNFLPNVCHHILLLQEGNKNETTSAETEAKEIKNHLKFSYFATTFTGAGIISFYTVFEANAREAKDPYFVILFVFIMASFTSGASLIILSSPYCCKQVPVEVFRRLQHTSLVSLILAVLVVCIKIMKGLVLVPIFLAFSFIVVSPVKRCLCIYKNWLW